MHFNSRSPAIFLSHSGISSADIVVKTNSSAWYELQSCSIHSFFHSFIRLSIHPFTRSLCFSICVNRHECRLWKAYDDSLCSRNSSKSRRGRKATARSKDTQHSYLLSVKWRVGQYKQALTHQLSQSVTKPGNHENIRTLNFNVAQTPTTTAAAARGIARLICSWRLLFRYGSWAFVASLRRLEARELAQTSVSLRLDKRSLTTALLSLVCAVCLSLGSEI